MVEVNRLAGQARRLRATLRDALAADVPAAVALRDWWLRQGGLGEWDNECAQVLTWTRMALVRADPDLERLALPFAVELPLGTSPTYDEFLAAFDPRGRVSSGVWSTPPGLVQHMMGEADAAAREAFDSDLGLADPGLGGIGDPCAGTGAFPLGLARWVRDSLRGSGEGSWEKIALDLASRLWIRERHLAPLLVCRQRVQEALSGAELDASVADTLERPTARPLSVVIANPPWERGRAGRAGWLGAAGGPLDAFVEPARAQGAGRHLKNLYNQYVYFWRWAGWRVFDTRSGPGVICLLTPASFLDGPAFVGLRAYLRSAAERISIVELGGDQRGGARSHNAFGIRTPLAITTVWRRGKRSGAARVTHTNLRGRIGTAATSPAASFIPQGSRTWLRWAPLSSLFPWCHSGVQYKRTWPVAPDPDVLVQRWRALLSDPDQGTAFRETAARSVARAVRSGGEQLPPLMSLPSDASTPPIIRYGYRFLDWQWALLDPRLCDRSRPSLLATRIPGQLYLVSLMSKRLGPGPAAVVSPWLPDLDHFCNRGGRDVMPLWLAPGVANLNAAITTPVADRLGRCPSPMEWLAYVYGVLANPRFGERFADDLRNEGPRIPISAAAFDRVTALGIRLLGWHTYGRFGAAAPAGATELRAPEELPRLERLLSPSGGTAGAGDLRLPDAVSDFTVSGYGVVRGWLNYRVGRRKGKSPLDSLRPDRWPRSWTRELLELCWAIEATLGLQAELDASMEAILGDD